jgi:uncharacterized protein
LSRAAPAGPQPADHFVYDPANPVPSRGGNSCCSIAFAPVGPYDQAAIEQRSDVLVYATPPLSEAMEVTGPVTVDLYAASSAVDTDFTAKLVDVYPDGKAFNVSQGIVRALPRLIGEAHAVDAGRRHRVQDRADADQQCVQVRTSDSS